MKEEERIGKLKASLESLIEDYLGKDINNYQKPGVKEFYWVGYGDTYELWKKGILKQRRRQQS